MEKKDSVRRVKNVRTDQIKNHFLFKIELIFIQTHI